MKNEGKRFFGGVLLLTMSGAAVKICGLLFKIPLFAVIGEEGMGYFSSAYVIYTFFFVLSTSGLPVGLSILISGSAVFEEKRRFLSAALLSFGAIGVFLGAFMSVCSERAALLIGNPGAAPSIFILGPTLVFVCLSGALRGYFQGQRRMLETAVSQMIEALFKTLCGILLSAYAVKKGFGASLSAAFALTGLLIGAFLSFLYLTVCLMARKEERSFRSRRRFKNLLPAGYHFKRLFSVVLPVGGASMVMSVASLLDLALVMRRLQAGGYTAEFANRLYGAYTGMAIPVFNLPSVLTAPVAAAVIPYLSSAIREKDREGAGLFASLSVRLTMLIALPCGAGIGVLSQPILYLLFGEASKGNAAGMLALLSLSIPFVALQTTAGAILQSNGRRVIPVVSMIIGSAVKLAACYVLIPLFGMAGAPAGTFLCYAVSAFVDIVFASRYLSKGYGFFRSSFPPLIAGALCAAAAFFTHKGLLLLPLMRSFRGAPALFLSIAAAVVTYFVFTALFGCYDTEMAKLAPGFSKLFLLSGRIKERLHPFHERKRKRIHERTLQF